MAMEKLAQVNLLSVPKSSRPEVFCKRSILRNFGRFTEKHLYQSIFIKKENLAQVFSCEFCEISKITFSYRTLLVAASGNKSFYIIQSNEMIT